MPSVNVSTSVQCPLDAVHTSVVMTRHTATYPLVILPYCNIPGVVEPVIIDISISSITKVYAMCAYKVHTCTIYNVHCTSGGQVWHVGLGTSGTSMQELWYTNLTIKKHQMCTCNWRGPRLLSGKPWVLGTEKLLLIFLIVLGYKACVRWIVVPGLCN